MRKIVVVVRESSSFLTILRLFAYQENLVQVFQENF